MHPLYARVSLGVLGDYVTLDAGTGAVHTAPGHGADDFNTGVRYGLDIYAPGRPGRPLPRHGGPVRRAARLRREPERRGGAEGARRALAPRRLRAPVPALLALPQPGDLPGDVAVVHPDGRRPGRRPGRRKTLRQAGLDADRQRRHVDPGVGPRPDVQHAREPSRLVHLAPARVGRADPRRRLHGVRRGDPHRRRWSSARRRCSTSTAPTPGTSGRSRSSPGGPRLPVVRRHGVRARARHPRRLVRLGIEPRGGAAVPTPS